MSFIVKKEGERVLAVRIDEDFYKEIKIRLANKNMTLKAYLTELIEEDLRSADDEKDDIDIKEVMAKANEITELLNRYLEIKK